MILSPPPQQPVIEQIDLDLDGANDVTFVVGSASSPDADGHDGWVNVFGLPGALVAFDGNYPIAFEASDHVSSGFTFRSAIGTLAVSSAGPLGDRGHWFAGHEGYLGIRLERDGFHYYGWLHAIWDADAHTLIIDRGGYEDSGLPAHIPRPEPEESIVMEITVDAGAGAVEVGWMGEEGASYNVLHSADGENWTTIHSVTAAAAGPLSCADVQADFPRPVALYRVEKMSSPLLLLALGIRRNGRRNHREG